MGLLGKVGKIRVISTIYNNMGTGIHTSCIDGLIDGAIFKPGERIQVWADRNGTLRGNFVVSEVEFTTICQQFRWLYKWFPEKTKVMSKIWSAQSLPTGTVGGDLLVVE